MNWNIDDCTEVKTSLSANNLLSLSSVLTGANIMDQNDDSVVDVIGFDRHSLLHESSVLFDCVYFCCDSN